MKTTAKYIYIRKYFQDKFSTVRIHLVGYTYLILQLYNSKNLTVSSFKIHWPFRSPKCPATGLKRFLQS